MATSSEYNTSPEYNTIVMCTPKLTTALSANTNAISEELLASGLINRPIRKKMLSPGISDDLKAGELVQCVTDQIEIELESYHTFIEVLKKDRFYDSTIKVLEDKYRELRQNPELCCRRSSSTPSIPATLSSVTSFHSISVEKNGRSTKESGPGSRAASVTERTSSVESAERTISASLHGQESPTLKIATRALYDVRAKWKDIAIELDVDPGTIDSIDLQHRDPKYKLYDILKNLKPSWRKILDALESKVVGETELARELRVKWCGNQEGDEEVKLKKQKIEDTSTGLHVTELLQNPALYYRRSSSTPSVPATPSSVTSSHSVFMDVEKDDGETQSMKDGGGTAASLKGEVGPKPDSEGMLSSAQAGARFQDIIQLECNIPNVLLAIDDVQDPRGLGLQLKIRPAKLRQIESDHCTQDQKKSHMVKAWFENDNPTWKKLEDALKTPALSENQVARRIEGIRKGSSAESLSSSALMYLQNAAALPEEEDELLPCDVANVVNAIAKVKYCFQLGDYLGIEEHHLSSIRLQHRPIEYPQRMVEVWFKVGSDCSWESLHKAMQRVQMSEGLENTLVKGSSFESTSEYSNGSTHTRDSFSVSSSDQGICPEDYCPSVAVKKKNCIEIKRLYLKLMKLVTKKLKEAKLDMEEFIEFVIEIFDRHECIPEQSKDIEEIFKALTKNRLWGYLDVDHLESIAEEVGDKSIQDLINVYVMQLNGYKAATKIADHIKEVNCDEYQNLPCELSEDKYNGTYLRKLSLKLSGEKFGINLSFESLEYVQKVLKKVCNKFYMPPLSAILDEILPGSVIITWLIPFMSAQRILEHVQKAADFFQSEMIVAVAIDDTYIYDETTGVADEKVINSLCLLIACEVGKLQEYQSVLRKVDIDTVKTKSGKTLLMTACELGYSKDVDFLLNGDEFKVNVDTVDSNGWNSLFYAVKGGHLDIVKELIDKVHISQIDKDGSSLVDIAHNYNSSEVVCDIKRELMFSAAKSGNLEMVKRLIDSGMDPDTRQEDKYNWTPLMWASNRGYLSVVQYLLNNNAQVDAKGKDSSWTSLILASRKGYLDIVKLLVNRGADVNNQTKDLWSSLTWTAQEGHTDVAKFLLDNGANTDTQDEAGFTPLTQASQDGHLDIVEVLIDHDPDVNLNHQTKSTWTALMVAALFGHPEVVKKLVERGAEVDFQKEDDVTAMHIACYQGHNNVVRQLYLHHKANVNIQDKDGITPLMFAIESRRVDVVKTLLWNAKADVNISGNEAGWSAPFFAVQKESQDILELLMKTGKVDLNIKDNGNNTLVDLAEKLNNTAALKYLQQMQPKTIKTTPTVPGSSGRPQLMKSKKVDLDYFMPMLNRMSKKITSDPRQEIATSAA